VRRVECEFEPEALAAAVQSRWPGRVAPDLRAHIAECPICSDVVTLALVFDEAREDSRACPNVPDAGRVWRAAQVRARREAVAKAMAPISFAQMIGFGCALGIAGACFGASSIWLQSVLARVVTGLSGENVRALVALSAQHGFVIAGAVLIVLVPAAAWLTDSGD